MNGSAANSSGFTKIAIAASFTAESLSQSLEFWMERLGIPSQIKFAPHNQIFQQLLDPSSLLCSNRGGINVILMRFEDWQPQDRVLEMERAVDDFLHGLGQARQCSSASFLICLCPEPRPSTLVRDLHAVISSQVPALSGMYLIDTEELLTNYPVGKIHDSRSDELAYIPYTPLYFTALGTIIARRIRTLLASPYKVIVLDCDQTLWSGLCGEDGPSGIRITPEYAVLQDFMVQQHRAGMILCLCSKNNQEDVAAVFHAHPEMPLQRSSFVSERINWVAKSENLKALASELGLLLDAFIFIDDDPVQCAEVRANCTEVLTLQLPSEPAAIPDFINHIWALDRIALTDEDRERNGFYRNNIQREQLQRELPTFTRFLAELELTVELLPISAPDIPRASQLTYRTNQFNFTGVRRSEAELRDMVESHTTECVGAHVSDRFGDYGLVGLITFATFTGVLNVENFLLSCRAMGKGVEHQMLAWLGHNAIKRGIENLNLRFVTTPKNLPARLFLDSLNIGLTENIDGTSSMKISADSAARCRFDPDAVDHVREQVASRTEEKGDVVRSNTRQHVAPFSLIASELNTVEKIHSAIHVEKSRVAQTTRSEASTLPETSIEKEVAAVWLEFLGIDSVQKDENFFNAGGHSLVAMQVLSRLCEIFDVELSPSLIFGDFTVASLSQAILTEQLRDSDLDELELILKKVDGLSEEEAKKILESQEEDG